MKSRIFLASGFFALALLCPPPTHGQPKGTPRRPTPETGKPIPTGTVTGGTQNVINSKLLIYTKNGVGTTYTNTGGEFPSQLAASATVNNQFTLQWTRTKPGKVEKSNIFVTRKVKPVGGEFGYMGDGVLSVTMPAQSTSVNIPFSFSSLEPDPKLPPDTYELMVVGETGSSSKVTINYTGKGSGGSSMVIKPGPTTGSAPVQTSTVKVTGAKFTPEVGVLGEPGHKRARLTLTLRTLATTTISKIEVEASSEPWTNPELITSSNSKNSPIVILNGKWTTFGGSYQILKEKDNQITVVLRRTSKNDVEAQETGIGVYSPSDWGYAFGQTTTASFRWNVDGKLSGSLDQSPKKLWQWGAP